MKQLSKHLSFANVMSCLALFLALGGAAYAAKTASKVKTKDLGNGAVTTPKLRNGAVTTPKLRNRSVISSKIAAGNVGTEALAKGAVRSEQLGGQVVTEPKIKNGAVTDNKLGSESVTTGKLQKEAVTAAKLSSSFLAQLVKNVSYESATSATDSSSPKTVTAACPSGKVAIAGGAKLTLGEAIGVALSESAPTAPDSQGKRTGWTATAHEVVSTETESWSVTAYAVCAEL